MNFVGHIFTDSFKENVKSTKINLAKVAHLKESLS